MRSRRAHRERGMVTAELAAALPVLVALLAVALTAVSVVAARVRAQDAAREAARAAARGDPATGSRLARESAPGSSVELGHDAGGVTAVVRTTVRPLGDWLPAFTVSERAVAALEPTAAAAGP